MSKVTRLISSMFRVGLIGFGGGNALIPILEQIAVDEQKLVSQEEYDEDVVVASITPGALPVEIAGGIGRRSIGSAGLLVGSISLALPGVILTLVLSAVISVLSSSVLLQIRDVCNTAVTHCVDYLACCKGYVVVERAGIRNVRVYTLFKSHTLLSAKVVTLPVAGAV